MGGMSRSKGQRGELQAAAVLSELLGHRVRRRVRQHEGDSDLEGVPGWCVEVKRVKACPPSMLAQYWEQAVRQAEQAGLLPLLMVRTDRAKDWSCYWPAATHADGCHAYSLNVADTLHADPLVWWRMTRKLIPTLLGTPVSGSPYDPLARVICAPSKL